MTSEAEVAWAAGLFEGEGSFTTNPGRLRSDGTHKRYLRLDMTSTDLDVLQRFQRIVGVGAIYPHTRDHRNPNGRRAWHWGVQGERPFNIVLRLFTPHLGERRLATALALVAKHGSPVDDMLDGKRSVAA